MRGVAKHYYSFLPALQVLLIPNTIQQPILLQINPSVPGHGACATNEILEVLATLLATLCIVAALSSN